MNIHEYVLKLEGLPEEIKKCMMQSVDIWSTEACLAYFVVAAQKSSLSTKQICEVYGWMENALNWFDIEEIVSEAEEIYNKEK